MHIAYCILHIAYCILHIYTMDMEANMTPEININQFCSSLELLDDLVCKKFGEDNNFS
jgi:hypothetical protein